MADLKEIINSKDIGATISFLRQRVLDIPYWSFLIRDYEPKLHEIVEDKIGRPDKILDNGNVERAARLPLGLEKLLTRRISEFTLAIPVKRVYHYDRNDDVLKQIVYAIEKVYENAHINAENMHRAICYYASCQMFTLWYVQKKPNNLYGFDSLYKLKCKTFSPMDGVEIFPFFDEYGDMLALSFEYKQKIIDTDYTFFETFTSDYHYKWKTPSGEKKGWEEVSQDPIQINKIPAVFWYRHEPCWEGLKPIRENIEYTISRNSDVIAYNSAPVLKVAGSIVGQEQKGATQRIFRVAEEGDVSYVSWQQSIDALKYHVDTLVKLYFMQSQMPDISFENMKSLGNIGYDARKTLLMDAHLKIGEETGAWVEGFERESNIIKAFIGQMNKKWENRMDEISIEHIITPFIQEDEMTQIEKWMKGNGGKPIVSQRESIYRSGISPNPDATYKEIIEEEDAEANRTASRLPNIFSGE